MLSLSGRGRILAALRGMGKGSFPLFHVQGGHASKFGLIWADLSRVGCSDDPWRVTDN